MELGRRYAREGADELVFLDITATHEGRKLFEDLVGRIAAHLKNCGATLLVRRQDLCSRRERRTVAHVDNVGKALRHETTERIVLQPVRITDAEGQRRRLRGAAGCNGQNLRAQPDAEYRTALIEHVSSQCDFTLQRRHVPLARAPPGPAAEQDQPVADIARSRNRALLRERAKVAKADAPALQVIFQQAQIVGRGVLYDIEQVHQAFNAFSKAAMKSSGETDSTSTPAWPKNSCTTAGSSSRCTPRRRDSRS